MVNGPPTPPATTPAELQDEARTYSSLADSSESTQPIQNAPQNRTEIYQGVLPLLSEAIATNAYERLVRIAEETDYNSANDRQQSRLLIVAPLVLGHLVLDDLTLARYALLRLPDNLQFLPLSRALMVLVTSAMNRDHATVYDQANSLHDLVSQPDFTDKDLASAITNLLSAFLDRFRERTFALLSKAYTSLPLALMSIYLAQPADRIISVAQEYSWSYDPSTHILSPIARSKPSGFVSPSPSSLTTFHFVADSVAMLEG